MSNGFVSPHFTYCEDIRENVADYIDSFVSDIAVAFCYSLLNAGF